MVAEIANYLVTCLTCSKPGVWKRLVLNKVHEGVVLDPMLLFRGWTFIKMELTCKLLGQNLQN